VEAFFKHVILDLTHPSGNIVTCRNALWWWIWMGRCFWGTAPGIIYGLFCSANLGRYRGLLPEACRDGRR